MKLNKYVENRVRFTLPGEQNKRNAIIDYGSRNVRINRDLYINGAPVADYVIEQGTDGMWTYRKWNSGIAECWGVYTQTLHTAAAGNAYIMSGNTINFPNGLFTELPIPSVNSQGPAYCHPTVWEIQKTHIKMYFITLWASTANTDVYIRAIGKWK